MPMTEVTTHVGLSTEVVATHGPFGERQFGETYSQALDAPEYSEQASATSPSDAPPAMCSIRN